MLCSAIAMHVPEAKMGAGVQLLMTKEGINSRTKKKATGCGSGRSIAAINLQQNPNMELER